MNLPLGIVLVSYVDTPGRPAKVTLDRPVPVECEGTTHRARGSGETLDEAFADALAKLCPSPEPDQWNVPISGYLYGRYAKLATPTATVHAVGSGAPLPWTGMTWDQASKRLDEGWPVARRVWRDDNFIVRMTPHFDALMSDGVRWVRFSSENIDLRATDWYVADHLMTDTGAALDRLGARYGVTRGGGEADESYRGRLLGARGR